VSAYEARALQCDGSVSVRRDPSSMHNEPPKPQLMDFSMKYEGVIDKLGSS
jgi:hypothetical protein